MPRNDPALRLLHLSDLHFGMRFCEYGQFPGPRDWAGYAAHEIGVALHENDLRNEARATKDNSGKERYQFDCLIISGDLTCFNDQAGFDAAIAFVDLARQQWWAPRQVLLIPGNHDLEFGPRPRESKYVPQRPKVERAPQYRQTYLHIVGKPVPGEHFGVLLPDSGTRTALIGLDSCRVEGWNYPGIGFVGYDQIVDIAQGLRNLPDVEPDTPWRVLAFLHHHVLTPGTTDASDQPLLGNDMAAALYNTGSPSVLADREKVKDAASQFHIEFLCHGHWHVPDVHEEVNRQLAWGRVISAGSAMLQPDDCKNTQQFYVYELVEGESAVLRVHDIQRSRSPTGWTQWRPCEPLLDFPLAEPLLLDFPLAEPQIVPPLTIAMERSSRLARSRLDTFDSLPLAVSCLAPSVAYPVDGMCALSERIHAAWRLLPSLPVGADVALGRLFGYIQRNAARLLQEFTAMLDTDDPVRFEHFMLRVIFREGFHLSR